MCLSTQLIQVLRGKDLQAESTNALQCEVPCSLAWGHPGWKLPAASCQSAQASRPQHSDQQIFNHSLQKRTAPNKSSPFYPSLRCKRDLAQTEPDLKLGRCSTCIANKDMFTGLPRWPQSWETLPLLVYGIGQSALKFAWVLFTRGSVQGWSSNHV